MARLYPYVERRCGKSTPSGADPTGPPMGVPSCPSSATPFSFFEQQHETRGHKDFPIRMLRYPYAPLTLRCRSPREFLYPAGPLPGAVAGTVSTDAAVRRRRAP